LIEISSHATPTACTVFNNVATKEAVQKAANAGVRSGASAEWRSRFTLVVDAVTRAILS
jgi:hypothetical protein